MTKKTLKTMAAVGLILGISGNAVFAESGSTRNGDFNKTMDSLEQAQRNANSAASSRNIALLNAKELLEGSKENRKVYTEAKTSNNNNKPNNSAKNDVKPEHTGKKNTFLEEHNRNKKPSNNNPDRPNGGENNLKTPKHQSSNSNIRISKQNNRLMGAIYNAKNLDQLTSEQKMRLKELHRRVLKTQIGQILLATIQKGEGGGPLTIVGKGVGKSKKFKQIMRNLNFSTHPAYQFPKGMRCFYHNKDAKACSDASGLYQILKSNYDYYHKHFGINDFSIESQQIIALELIRTGRAKIVPGNFKGRGYIELLKGNINNAIRYGTNDWASSKFSEWKGRKTDYIKDAQIIAKDFDKKKPKGSNNQAKNSDKSKDLKDQKFFQNWLDEFEHEASS